MRVHNAPLLLWIWLITLCAGAWCRRTPSFAAPRAGAAATQPPPPLSGPGGSDTRFGGMEIRRCGVGGQACVVYAPKEPTLAQAAAQALAHAPVVVFTHGWGALEPLTYGAWISHLVRHDGAIVIYPLYQADLRTPTAEFLPNAVAGIRAALTLLKSGALGPRPDTTHAAYIGHSVGGLLAANLAAVAAHDGLPAPGAVMCVEPGRSWGPPMATVALVDLRQIPRGTLLLTVTGDQDQLAQDRDAIRIFRESTSVQPADKNRIVMHSDNHGVPPIVADHAAPTGLFETRLRARIGGGKAAPTLGAALGQVDALDYNGLWKLADGLTDAAWYGRNREFALGNTPQQRGMGRWSDGVEVRPVEVILAH